MLDSKNSNTCRHFYVKQTHLLQNSLVWASFSTVTHRNILNYGKQLTETRNCLSGVYEKTIDEG